MGNLMLTNDIPIKLVEILLKALKEESNLQAGTIQEHEGTIKDLKTWGSRKNWGLVGTIGSGIILLLGYLGYTISPC